MVSYEKTRAYLYIYAPERGAVGPGGEGRGQRLSQCFHWKHTDTVMISQQCCLLHSYCFTLRCQPDNRETFGVAGTSSRMARISTRKTAIFNVTVMLVVQLFHPLSGLAVDSISCMDAHCEVLEQSIASYQALQSQLLSKQVLFT